MDIVDLTKQDDRRVAALTFPTHNSLIMSAQLIRALPQEVFEASLIVSETVLTMMRDIMGKLTPEQVAESRAKVAQLMEKQREELRSQGKIEELKAKMEEAERLAEEAVKARNPA